MIRNYVINDRTIGESDAESTYHITPISDINDVLYHLAILVSLDNEDIVAQLDAIHVLIHEAKRQKILPLRTV